MEMTVIGLFVLSLFGCVVWGLPVLVALGFGLVLFLLFGLVRGHRPQALLRMAFSGIKTVRNILLVFLLIGVLTGFWRASGTIPTVVTYVLELFSPRVMVAVAFLLCCLLSFLTGSSFAATATAGVVCMTVASSIGVPPAYTGGAVLAGCYVGEYASPLCTSAMLVSTLTHIDHYRHLKRLARLAAVPVALAVVFYLLLGWSTQGADAGGALTPLWSRLFVRHPLTLLPAVVVLVFSLFRVPVKLTMAVSILCAGALAVGLQDIPWGALWRIAVWGYTPTDPAAAVLAGGGILSMANVFLVVLISSCYAGLWSGTGLLDGIQRRLRQLAQRISPYGAVLVTGLLTALITCSQTLCILMTHQLCRPLEPDDKRLALSLEGTAVLFPTCVPWSVACAGVLETVGAPLTSLVFAFFLPLVGIAIGLYQCKTSTVRS
ncbi:MAG: sodium:proton antiporter [Ruminococcaceae bacterium]|nr:sodium:proton antiporter [Oscillospiraceae bacterium]